MKDDKLARDLFHLKIALSDAEWELGNEKGHLPLKECIDLAKAYLEEVLKDIYDN